MKHAEFNALCNREHERDRSVVTGLYLTEESYAELLAETLAEGPLEFPEGAPPAGPVGVRLDAMTNPATRTVVSVGRAVTKGLFADTAEVTRWVTVTPA